MIIKSQTQFCFPVTQLQNKSIFSTNKCPIFISSTGKHGTPWTAARRIQGEGCLSHLVERATVGLLWARGRNPDQAGRDQNQLQSTGINLGSWQEPPLAEALGWWLPWSHYSKSASLSTSYHPQCLGSCKASTNFSTRFARVQTVRCGFTDVWFYVMMNFKHSISLCWARMQGSSL